MKGTKGPGAKAKDLPARKEIKGGKDKLATNDNLTLLRAAGATKKAKDLSLKSSESVKGGHGKRLNDSTTLVRGAKPTAKKRDLPARKDVKGGKKIA